MRSIHRCLLVFILVGASAAGRAADSPESVVRAFWAAAQADGVASAVPRFTHPAERLRFKQMLMPRIRRSYEVAGDEFTRELLGRDIPLKEIEAMAPTDFMAAFMWRSRLDGSDFKPPQFIGTRQHDDLAHVAVLTELTALDGKRVQRRDVVSLKAMGDTWRMTLSPELEAYVKVLLAQ